MLPLPVLIPALTLPTLAALIYFVLAAGHWSAALVYGGTKVAMVAGPLLCGWRWGWPAVAARSRSWGRSAGEGLAAGLLMAAGMLALAYGPLAWLVRDATPQITAKVAEFHLGTPAAFLAAALVISLLHSAFEEWYWRWFAVGQVQRRLPALPAQLVGGLAFAGHHVVVLWVYAGPAAGILLGLVVGAAGLCWSLLYRRHGTLLGAWIAHACCDVAIMLLGWTAMHPPIA